MKAATAMSSIISEQTETRLLDEARRQGISVDALLQRWMNEHAGSTGANGAEARAATLPVWHLGATGSFHRRDIYDDAG